MLWSHEVLYKHCSVSFPQSLAAAAPARQALPAYSLPPGAPPPGSGARGRDHRLRSDNPFSAGAVFRFASHRESLQSLYILIRRHWLLEQAKQQDLIPA